MASPINDNSAEKIATESDTSQAGSQGRKDGSNPDTPAKKLKDKGTKVSSSKPTRRPQNDPPMKSGGSGHAVVGKAKATGATGGKFEQDLNVKFDSLTQLLLQINRENKESRTELTARLEKLENLAACAQQPQGDEFDMPMEYPELDVGLNIHGQSAHEVSGSEYGEAGSEYSYGQGSDRPNRPTTGDRNERYPIPSDMASAGPEAMGSRPNSKPENETETDQTPKIANSSVATVNKGFAEKYAMPEEVGDPIDQYVADSVNFMISTKLQDKIVTETIDKYARPQNTLALRPQRVNQVIWKRMTPQTRTRDAHMQRIQNLLQKGLIALTANQTEASMKASQELQDAMMLISAANFETNSTRKFMIKPELNPVFMHLCDKPSGVEYLFGDDLSKIVKDATEENKAAAVCAKPPKKVFKNYPRQYQQGPPKPNNFIRYHPYGQNRGGGNNAYKNRNYGQQVQQNPFLGQRLQYQQGYPNVPQRQQQQRKQAPSTATRPSQ